MYVYMCGWVSILKILHTVNYKVWRGLADCGKDLTHYSKCDRQKASIGRKEIGKWQNLLNPVKGLLWPSNKYLLIQMGTW